jgi:aspartate/methionine/tyrosine aminotransferase
VTTSPAGPLAAPTLAETRIRPQIRDLQVENIARLAHLARDIPDVITLWYGEGDQVTPAFIRDAAKASLDRGETFYVPDMRGWPPLTAALAAYQTRLHGRSIGVERSTVTPGGMQAVYLALALVAEMGTNVVYLEPQWPNIRHAIHVVGAEPRPVALREASGAWRLDLDAVRRACDARTRAIVFSTPSNPMGWTASEDELRALLALGRERGVWIVSDELYNRLRFGADSAPSILSIAEDEDLALSVNGFSKAWAMTGWRVGWLTHPPSVGPALSAMTQYVNSGVSAFAQAGALAALEAGEDTAHAIRDRCAEGVEIAYRILGPVNRIRLSDRPRAGMYVFFAVEGEADAAPLCRRLLEEARVGLAPGWLFGEAARAHLRMCVCRNPAEVEEACRRIAAALAA